MKQIYTNRILYIAPAILALWLTLAAIATTLIDPRTFILALALLALTSTVAIIRLFPLGGWVTAVVSILVYGATEVNLSGWTDRIILPLIVTSVALLLTAWFGTIINHQVMAVYRQIDHDQSLIDDLRIRDPQTGLMRYVYAQQTLRNEIGRSRRNNSSLCLLLAQVADWEALVNQQGIVVAEDIKEQIAEVFKSTLRIVDTTFIAGAFGAILPETDPNGALVVARRLVDVISRRSRVDLRIGIAQFPTDGVTEQELQKAAEATLQHALTSDHTIALHSQIQEMQGEV